MVVVVPSVSVGNVPQLALDLLIHTYGFQVARSLDDEHLYPFAGPLDYVPGTASKQEGLSTACQLFTLDDISLVQLRSPPLPGRKRAFVATLQDAFPSEKTLIVGSANAGMQLDGVGASRLVEFTKENAPSLLPESGFVKDALALPKSSALVMYTYEGDNIRNAKDMAQELAERLGLPAKEFVQPISWNRVYGRDIPLGVEQGLYT